LSEKDDETKLELLNMCAHFQEGTATCPVPRNGGYTNDVYASLDPITGKAILYPPNIAMSIHGAYQAGYQRLSIPEIHNATVHFYPDGRMLQTTVTGGFRSVFCAPVQNDCITCSTYFDPTHQSWYVSTPAAPVAGGAAPAAAGGAAAMQVDAHTTTHIGFCVDKSSSMGNLYRTVVESGIETFLMKQIAEVPHPLRFYALTFSNSVDEMYNGVDLRAQTDIRNRFYSIVPNGSTAYYDAVLRCIEMIEAQYTDGDEVVICIMTDGQDNVSQNCNLFTLQQKIREKKALGWQIVMFGTDDIDVERMGAAQGIGQQSSLSVGRSVQEANRAFQNVCDGLRRVRMGDDAQITFTQSERGAAYQTSPANE
jgi:hypothetical protein